MTDTIFDKMRLKNLLTLSTSPKLQPKGKPRNFTSLSLRRRSLCRRTLRYYTGKELDSETGLYYYGARYLDPKTSRWISGDPAVGEYIPSAGAENNKLPNGGVYNSINFHIYHYSNNNPVKYTDPDGKFPKAYIDTRRRKELNGGKNHRMETAQNIARNASIYKQGAGGRWTLLGPDFTFCNQATFDTAEALGFNTDALYAGENRDWTNANKAAQNLASAASKGTITEVTGEKAQTLANDGYLVIGAMEIPKGIGHLATVRPSDTAYDSSKGPLLSNVGPLKRTGINTTVDSFGQKDYESGKVKFYYDPNQKFSYDPSVIAQRQN